MIMQDIPDGEHEFTLIVTPAVDLDRRIMDALYEAGCDDANVSLRDGVMRLAFTRAAKSLTHAVDSAIRDVNRAGLGLSISAIEDYDETDWLKQVSGIILGNTAFDEVVKLGERMRREAVYEDS